MAWKVPAAGFAPAASKQLPSYLPISPPMTLSIIALMETDDLWIVGVTVIAVLLVVILLVVDLYRVIDDSAPESRGDG